MRARLTHCRLLRVIALAVIAAAPPAAADAQTSSYTFATLPGGRRAVGCRESLRRVIWRADFTVTGTLAPGTYDLVVFAHSAATNSFAGAQTVRVIIRVTGGPQ